MTAQLSSSGDLKSHPRVRRYKPYTTFKLVISVEPFTEKLVIQSCSIAQTLIAKIEVKLRHFSALEFGTLRSDITSNDY